MNEATPDFETLFDALGEDLRNDIFSMLRDGDVQEIKKMRAESRSALALATEVLDCSDQQEMTKVITGYRDQFDASDQQFIDRLLNKEQEERVEILNIVGQRSAFVLGILSGERASSILANECH